MPVFDDTAHRTKKFKCRWQKLLWHVSVLILTVTIQLSCITTSETDIHLVMGPSTELFPYGVKTVSAIQSDFDKADLLVRYALTMRSVAPDNAALLLEEAIAITVQQSPQSTISQEQLGNIPYYSRPPLQLISSIQLANLYIDVAEALFLIDNENELNREIITEILEQSLFHLKLIEHGVEHSEALSRLFLLSNQLDVAGEQIRDTCVSIAVSYKVLSIKLALLSDMAIALYVDEQIIANNILGHFEVAYIQSSNQHAVDALIANLMTQKINRAIPDYQLNADVALQIDTDTFVTVANETLVRISGYISTNAPQLFDRFYDNQFDTTTKLDMILEFIRSNNNRQQQELYTRQFIAEHELLPNAARYPQLHMILPFAIEYVPDSAPMLITQTANQNYYQSLRAYTISTQQYLTQGDVSTAQEYFERIYSRLPTGYPTADALNYYATYEQIYGRSQLMELMIAHRTEPTLSSARLLLLLQSSISQPFSLQEQQLLAQIVQQ